MASARFTVIRNILGSFVRWKPPLATRKHRDFTVREGLPRDEEAEIVRSGQQPGSRDWAWLGGLYTLATGAFLHPRGSGFSLRAVGLGRAGPLLHRARRLLHRAGRLLHRAGRLLHRAGRPLHRAGRPLHRAGLPLHRVRRPLHDVRRPLHDLIRTGSYSGDGPNPALTGKCQVQSAKFKEQPGLRAEPWLFHRSLITAHRSPPTDHRPPITAHGNTRPFQGRVWVERGTQLRVEMDSGNRWITSCPRRAWREPSRSVRQRARRSP